MPSHMNQKMSKTLVQTFLAGAMLAGGLGFYLAQPSSADALRSAQAGSPTRVAVVDAMRVVNSLEELQEMQAQFNQAMTEAQGRLDRLRDSEDLLVEDLENLELNEEARREKIIELANLRGQAAGTREALQGVLTVEQGNIIGDLYGKVITTVSRIAERDGYDLVLVNDASIIPPRNVPAQNVQNVLRDRRVLFASGTIDLTDQAIEEMNALFRAG